MTSKLSKATFHVDYIYSLYIPLLEPTVGVSLLNIESISIAGVVP